VIWNHRPQPPTLSLGCLLERRRADEVGDAFCTRMDCGAPFPGPFTVRGDAVEKVMSRSSQPHRCDQRADFERLAVIGQAVDDVFHEFLRQPHLFDIVQSWPKDSRREVTSQPECRGRIKRHMTTGLLRIYRKLDPPSGKSALDFMRL